MKTVFLKLWENGQSVSLAVKTTYFTNKVNYLNPEEEGSRCTKNGFPAKTILKFKWV